MDDATLDGAEEGFALLGEDARDGQACAMCDGGVHIVEGSFECFCYEDTDGRLARPHEARDDKIL